MNKAIFGLETIREVRATIGKRQVGKLHGRICEAPKSEIGRANIVVVGETREKNGQGGKGDEGWAESP